MYRVKAQTQDLARRCQNSRWPVDSTTVLVAQQAGLAGARNIGRLLSSLTPRIQTASYLGLDALAACSRSKRRRSRNGMVGRSKIGENRPMFPASNPSIRGLSFGSSFRM